MADLIDRQAVVEALDIPDYENGEAYSQYVNDKRAIELVPSAEPDFSCDGCQTPKHICGICMRNYPNITDHYCTGEAWRDE